MFDEFDTAFSFANKQRELLEAMESVSQATQHSDSTFFKDWGWYPTKRIMVSYSLITQVAYWVGLAGYAPCNMVQGCAAAMTDCINFDGELPDVVIDAEGNTMNQRDLCRMFYDFPLRDIPLDPADPTAYPFRLDATWTHPVLAADGLVQPKYFNWMLTIFKKLPRVDPMMTYLDPTGGGSAYALADLASANVAKYNGFETEWDEMYSDANNCDVVASKEQGTEVLKDPAQDGFCILKCTFMIQTFYVTKLSMADQQQYLDVVQDTLDRLAKADKEIKRHASIFSVPHTYWAVYRRLKEYFWQAFGVACAVIFATVLVFLRSPASAIACTLTAATIVIELYGIFGQVALWNMLSSATLLMAVGVAIEFCAHIIATNSESQGDPETRLVDTMLLTFSPIMKGTLSTFLGVVLMSTSPFPVVVRYFFSFLAALCAVGLINAFLFLPAVLALLNNLMPQSDDVIREVTSSGKKRGSI